MTELEKSAIEHYEAALKEAFPSGATGDVFHHWNEARKALEQPAQMPEAYWLIAPNGEYYKNPKHPMNLEQPARNWVELTSKEIYECEPKTDWYDVVDFGRAIEAKLKEKNNV